MFSSGRPMAEMMIWQQGWRSGWVIDCWTAVRGLIPARNKYFYDMPVVVPGLGVYLYVSFLYLQIQEKFLLWGNIIIS